jgi:hypothetical protein
LVTLGIDSTKLETLFISTFLFFNNTDLWGMNFKLEGYNECLITYILGVASPTHPIPVAAYDQAWARNGAIFNGGVQYGLPVILNYNGATGNVGPMFWSHYSYLGLDPNNLSDKYADYWALTQNHAKIILLMYHFFLTF